MNDIHDSSKLIDDRIGENTRKFGSCACCSHAAFKLYKHGTQEAFCIFNHMKPIRLSSMNPIADCSLFYDKLAPSLPEMARMATIIEIKRKAGFVDNKEVIISRPEDRGCSPEEIIFDED